MYSTEIIKMANLSQYIYNNMQGLFNGVISVKYSSYVLTWDSYCLLIRGKNIGVISLSNIPSKQSKSLDVNYISTNSKRIIMPYEDINFKSYFNKDLIVETADIIQSEESYFQYLTLADLPEYEELKDIYNSCIKMVEMKMSYCGTYRMPKFNIEKIVSAFVKQHPQTNGFWGDLKYD